MSVTINNNSGLIGSPESGCGCGNRKYYTKAEIDEMLKDILDPEQIMAIVEQIVGEYVESEEFREIVISVIGEDYYTKAQIDSLLDGYATKSEIPSLEGYATQEWVGDQGFLKDITLTINGTELHNNGSIDVGGGGDISGKLDITAFTQAMESETARTEETYAKKNEIPSLAGYATEQWVQNQGYLTQHQSLDNYYTKNQTDAAITSSTQDMATKTWVGQQGYLTQHQDISGKLDTTAFTQFQTAMTECCEDVKGDISDIWEAIKIITGGTIPTGETGDWVIRIYLDVTSTTIPTKVTGQGTSGNTFEMAILDNGSDILDDLVWGTGSGQNLGYYYTFGNTGERYIDFYYKKNVIPYVSKGFDAVQSMFSAVVNDNVPRMQSLFGESDNLTSVTIGNNVQEIGLTCFYGCDGLTAITIPDSVKVIGRDAFAGCSNLSEITIGSGLTNISKSAFANCVSLETVTFKNALMRVEEGAFSACTSLESVIFGTALSFIGDSCFEGCSSLNSITFTGAVPPTLDGDRVFYGVSQTGTYYYPTGYDYSRIANALPGGWVGIEV